MKVVLVNKFYYPRGGDCLYTGALEALLNAKGHEVAIFAMQHPLNKRSYWERYFPKEVYFEESLDGNSGGFSAKTSALKRIFGVGDINERFEDLLDHFKPDVVHLGNIHSYLSPIVAEIAHRHNIKVVWTLHDYKLTCPSYLCLYQGKPCDECISHKFAVVKKRCFKDSYIASIVAYAEALFWNRKRLERSTDRFICPSRFMQEKMIEASFDPKKLIFAPNFISTELLTSVSEAQDYYCYVGRLSSEKGILNVIKAARTVPYDFKIAGDGPLAAQCRNLAKGYENIQFLGQISSVEVMSLLAGAKFSMCVSECYENSPLSVLESLALGVPVIGGQKGAVAELISHGINGLLTAGDEQAITQAIDEMWQSDFSLVQRQKIAAQAILKYSSSTYYETLIQIYNP